MSQRASISNGDDAPIAGNDWIFAKDTGEEPSA